MSYEILSGEGLAAYQREWRVKGYGVAPKAVLPSQRTATEVSQGLAPDLMLLSKAHVDGLHERIARLEAKVAAENARGGKARAVVAEIAHALGIVLNEAPLGHDIWSYENMRRAYHGVHELKAAVYTAKGHSRMATAALERTR